MDRDATRVLFYAPSLGDGGGQRLWAALATAFHHAGYDVLFAQDFESDEASDLLDADIPRHTLGQNHARATYNLARLLKHTEPDVALSAIAGSNLKLITARLLARAPTKVIQTFHGHNEWQTGWLSYLTARALPITSRLCARTVAVSAPLKDQLINRWHATPKRTVFLPNPVFLPKAISVPNAAQLKARAPIVLAVGRLTPDKDYLTLIKAFARLGNTAARLVIVGQGPEEAAIRALISDLGVEDRVSLEGFVKSPWPFYQTAKCLALSSSSESFGNVIVEALAHGLPVVATDTDGPKHILSSPEFGRRVPIGDVDVFAAALSATLASPGDPTPRIHHAQSYSLSARLADYENLIADVMRANPSKVGGQRNALT